MEEGISVSQKSYTKEIMKMFHSFDGNCVNTPMGSWTKLSKFDDEKKVDSTLFKSLVLDQIYSLQLE